MSDIKITMEEDYGSCGFEDNGCSGWESIKLTATDGVRTETVEDSSCFGVSAVKLFEELINKWVV